MSQQTQGGDFFGQGSYGCTFAPPPRCQKEESIVKTKNKSKKLAKVFDNKRSFETELELAKQLFKIDPTQKYFLYPISFCETTNTEIKYDKDAYKCSYFSNPNQAPKNYVMTKMVKGGVPLVDYVTKKKPKIHDFVRIMLPVFEGIELLGRRGLIHHDLKFDNILYQSRNKDTKIIDFGLMIPRKGAFSPLMNPYLHSDYWLHPPEYRIYSYLYSRVWGPLSIEDARIAFRTNLSLLHKRFSSEDPYSLHEYIVNHVYYYCDYENAFTSYIMDVCKRPNMIEGLKYMGKYASRIDVYSIGITMSYLSMYLDVNNEREHIKTMYRELLRGLLNPDPRKRLSIAKAKLIANTILQASTL